MARISVGDFWTIVTKGCELFNGSVTSGKRSADRNEMVGGHPESCHLKGLAADITFLPDWDEDAKKRCHDAFSWFYTKGLHGYIRRSRTSLHIQDRSAKAPK